MKRRKKSLLRRKSKSGASLLIVLISVTMLIVMGSTFGVIAVNSYNNSNRRLCQQQAYYTAESCLMVISEYMTQDPQRLAVLAQNIRDNTVDDVMKTEVSVADLGGTDGGGVQVPTNDIEALLLGYTGKCKITARAGDPGISSIRLISTGTYKGFQETVSARMACTTDGALELKKVFANSQCWKTPIVTLIADNTKGDMYFSSPGEYERDSNGTIINNTNNQNLRNNVYANVSTGNSSTITSKIHTKPFDVFNKPLKVQGTTYANPNFYSTGEAPAWYNDWVEIYMYSGSHGKGIDPIVNGNMYVNTKALIGLYDKNPAQVNYWQFWDPYRDENKVARNFVTYGDSYTATPFWNNQNMLGQRHEKYYEGYKDKHIEHGANTDIFFDYDATPPGYAASTLCHNGNMYLFDDARIECYDSTHTPNARRGIKNNIYAHKNLVIDGFAVDPNKGRNASDDSVPGSKNVNIFGDIMVEGNVMMSHARIYGDIYINGDEAIIADCDIFGTVYFNGSKLRMDYTHVYNDAKTKKADGTAPVNVAGKPIKRYSFETDEGKCVQLNGGHVVALGNTVSVTDPLRKVPMDGDFNADINNTRADLKWGAMLTNCSVHGTLLTRMNTRINVAYWPGATRVDPFERKIETNPGPYDIYGNIICDGYLMLDQTKLYRPSKWWDTASHDEFVALGINRIGVLGTTMAKRLQIRQTQMRAADTVEIGGTFIINNDNADDGYPMLQPFPRDYFEPDEFGSEYVSGNHPIYNNDDYRAINVRLNRVLVGEGGFYIDGARVWWNHGKSGRYVPRETDTGGELLNKDNPKRYDGQYSQAHKGIMICELYCNAVGREMYNIWDVSSGGIPKSGGWYDSNNRSTMTYKNTSPYYNKNLFWGLETHRTSYTKWRDINFKDIPASGYYFFWNDDGYAWSNVTNVMDTSKTNSDILNRMAEIIKGIIDNDAMRNPDQFEQGVAAGQGNGESKYPIRNTSFADMIWDLSQYFVTIKFTHRVNKYYEYVASRLNYEKYIPLTDMSDWALGEAGPYQKFDANATVGVWRNIKILKWSAPTDKKQKYIEVKPTGASNIITLNDLKKAGVARIEGKGINKKYVIKKSFHVADNGASRYKLVIPDNTIVVFDSKKGNLHCRLDGGIKIGENSQVILRGGNMTFLYLGADPKTITGTTIPVDLNTSNPFDTAKHNTLLEMGMNAKIGIVNGADGDVHKRDSIYIISNAVCGLELEQGASIAGYIYTPYGHLKINEERNYTYTDTASGKQVTGGSNTLVLKGSMLIRSFIVDIGSSYTDVLQKYRYLRYEYVEAPLIVDTNIQIGDTEQQIEDYGDPNWGFIGYD